MLLFEMIHGKKERGSHELHLFTIIYTSVYLLRCFRMKIFFTVLKAFLKAQTSSISRMSVFNFYKPFELFVLDTK